MTGMPGRMRAVLLWIALAAGLLALPIVAPAQNQKNPVDRHLDAMRAAAPVKAPARPARPRKLLLFSQTHGYHHHAIPFGLAALRILGEKTGAFEAVDSSNDLTYFEPENLAKYDAVCFLNTTGPVFQPRAEVEAAHTLARAEKKQRECDAILDLAGRFLDGPDLERLRRHTSPKRPPGPLTAGEIGPLKKVRDEQQKHAREARAALAEARKLSREAILQQSLLDFVKKGGGLVGIHAATDTYHEWPDYLALIGGQFAGHPWTADRTVAIQLVEPGHPVNAAFGGRGFSVKDEIYQIKGPYARNRLRVLLRLDVDPDGKEKISGIKGNRLDRDYAVSWIRRYGQGRVFYCSLGHNPEVYWNPAVLGHYLAGIQFALGDLEADARPSAEVALAAPVAPAGSAVPAAPATLSGHDLLVSSPDDYRVDPFMGVYPGRFTPDHGAPLQVETYVIADGQGRYRVVLASQPGRPPFRIHLTGQVEGDRVVVNGRAAGADWSGHIQAGRLTVQATSGNGGTLEGKFVERRSPTLGSPPPPGAVELLLFNGKPPSLAAWTNAAWKALPDGSMGVGKGSNATRRAFGDVRFHLEFRTPYEPERRGQARGNSGVYLMDRYEVQVLDSFGLVPRPNECGALYSMAAPTVHACLPPLRWQTYDIQFWAARFGEDGKTVLEPPRITVELNGIPIHKDVALPRTTGGGGASLQGHGRQGPLMLQDHGNPLRFRNIWAVETRKTQ